MLEPDLLELSQQASERILLNDSEIPDEARHFRPYSDPAPSGREARGNLLELIGRLSSIGLVALRSSRTVALGIFTVEAKEQK